MKRFIQQSRFTAALIAALSVNAALAAQPPDPTVSDASGNTAGGSSALLNLGTGTDNSAFGATALQLNTSGITNTAVGNSAMSSNTTGGRNTATGYQAFISNGFFNTTGYYNTANGVGTLQFITGDQNVAIGTNALFSGQVPIPALSSNTAVGFSALSSIGHGSNNNLGLAGGSNLRGGSNNIYLAANPGNASGESNSMRLGIAFGVPIAVFVAGINGTTLGGGSTVIVNATGQLGTVMSSARYKEQIQDMTDQGDKLLRLRPVTFRYKADASGQQQYGLIAEEVAQVYPELVVRGAQGEVESVQYHELIPVLLDEVQRQQKETARQQAELRRQQELAAAEERVLADLSARAGGMEAGAGRPDSVASR